MPPKLFPISLLNNITAQVQNELQKGALPYEIAFKEPASFYDLKLATFAIKNKTRLIVTFPVLLKSTENNLLKLYEIKMVPVPIHDADDALESYSEVLIPKPYIAASESRYIQLRISELRMCKKIQHDFYCEETFMVKHAHYSSCEGSLSYNNSATVVHRNCEFRFLQNSGVTPSVLDGGSSLVLANFPFKYGLTCEPHIMKTQPESSYMTVDHNILCNCQLNSDLTFLPQISQLVLTSRSG